jgi:hypothetical protein
MCCCMFPQVVQWDLIGIVCNSSELPPVMYMKTITQSRTKCPIPRNPCLLDYPSARMYLNISFEVLSDDRVGVFVVVVVVVGCRQIEDGRRMSIAIGSVPAIVTYEVTVAVPGSCCPIVARDGVSHWAADSFTVWLGRVGVGVGTSSKQKDVV